MSLVNIALLEPAISEPPRHGPRPSEPQPVQAPVPVENYMIAEEAIVRETDEQPLDTDDIHSESVENYTTTGEASGENSSGQAAAPSTGNGGTAGQSADYIRRNYNYLQRRIRDRLVYPPPARKAGIQGVTEVTFTIHEDGKVSGITVRKGSGHEILDNAAIQTIIAAAPFPKPPAPARIAIPIAFRLR
ncbi:MAG: TonB family protein [Spirochaetaceae bacterium]|nr:TonB family protein [Spirochaetaceae bacterium]